MSIVVFGCAVSVCAIAASSHAVYSGIVSAVVFAIVSVLVPEWRLNTRVLLSPGNWAILAFGLQLVIMPTIVSVFGAELGSLPAMPSQNAIEAAVLLSTLAFLGFIVGYAAMMRSRSKITAVAAWSYYPNLILPFAIIGLIGFIAAFGTHFSTLFLPVEKHPVVSQIRGFIGAMGRPFLVFSLLIVWARDIDRCAIAGRVKRAVVVTFLCGVVILILFATYGLGRNIFTIPLLAMVSVYGLRVRRLPLAGLLIGAIVVSVLSVTVGAYRQVSKTQNVRLGDASLEQRLSDAVHVSSNVQVYGGSPQFLAFVIEKTDWGRRLWWGSTLVPSLMYPVPDLGKGFRDGSGAAIYNRWIFGDLPVRDQNLPFEGELFMNFHLPGVVFGFFLLGIVIAALHRGFMGAQSALAAYVIQFAAVWVTFLVQGDSTSVAYIAVTFAWPMVFYGLVDYLSRHRKWARGMQHRVVRRGVSGKRRYGTPIEGELRIHRKVITP